MTVKHSATARILPTKHSKVLGWSDSATLVLFSLQGFKSYIQPLSLLLFKDPTPRLQGKFLMK